MECRATTAVLRIEDTRQGDKNLSGYDPLNPEHEATGWVLWVNSTNMYKYFTFHLGAQPLELYKIILNKLLSFVRI
jgi:hypothetical protein